MLQGKNCHRSVSLNGVDRDNHTLHTGPSRPNAAIHRGRDHALLSVKAARSKRPHGAEGRAPQVRLDPDTDTVAWTSGALTAPSRLLILGRLREGPLSANEIVKSDVAPFFERYLLEDASGLSPHDPDLRGHSALDHSPLVPTRTLQCISPRLRLSRRVREIWILARKCATQCGEAPHAETV
jgi:hypothetical protein